jgi:feruloyl esterase
MHLTKCADTKGRLRRVGLLLAIWASAIAGADSSHAADGCASLKDLKIDDATITAAEGVPAGFFTAGDSKSYANLPAFCRVTATLSPMHDSSIRVEMWLPQDGWKSVFEGTGTGGFGGRFIYPALAS